MTLNTATPPVESLVSPVDEGFTDKVANQLSAERRGASIIYPMVEDQSITTDPRNTIAANSCIVGLRLVAPHSVERADVPYVQFIVEREDKPDAIVVPRPSTDAFS